MLSDPILPVFIHNFPAMLPEGFRPRAALGPGDFPCKWHFDIKMLCLRHQERTEYGVVLCQEIFDRKLKCSLQVSFDVIGMVVWLTVFCVIKAVFHPFLPDESASLPSIAVVLSAFNILCALSMLPLTGLIERLVGELMPEARQPEAVAGLDERLLMNPPIALNRFLEIASDMAKAAVGALREGLLAICQSLLHPFVKRKKSPTTIMRKPSAVLASACSSPTHQKVLRGLGKRNVREWGGDLGKH